MKMETLGSSPGVTVTASSRQESTKKHIRGSSLLLFGRSFSLVLDFAIQVLIVRYLTKSDYGAFAYALSVVSLGSSFTVFGLDKSITRFVPIYHERAEYNKMFGTIIMMIGTILAIGLALVVALFGFQGWIADSLVKDPQALSLLLILILLSPVQAIDALLEGMFAIFANPRAIFFRKYLLGPGLKLAVVLILILIESDVYFLAAGYLSAGVLGISIYSVMLFRTLRAQGLFEHFDLRKIDMPVREVYGFTIPLLITDLVFVMRSSVVVMLLGYFHSTADVAAFRAVVPVAKQNMVVYQSFTFLFTPVASRMFAHDDREGVNGLYWQTAIWIAVISFPIFAVSFSLSRPLTVLLFGERYAQSGIIMALLAFGYYFNAALGFNGLTLRVYGKVRYIITGDLIGVIAGLAINVWLIRHYGAIGAAAGTCLTLVAQNIFYQAGLRLGTGIRLFDWHYLRVYLSIVIGAAALLTVQLFVDPPLYADFLLGAVVSLSVIWLNRSLLNVEQTFPEVLRLPFARRIFAVGRPS